MYLHRDFPRFPLFDPQRSRKQSNAHEVSFQFQHVRHQSARTLVQGNAAYDVRPVRCARKIREPQLLDHRRSAVARNVLDYKPEHSRLLLLAHRVGAYRSARNRLARRFHHGSRVENRGNLDVSRPQRTRRKPEREILRSVVTPVHGVQRAGTEVSRSETQIAVARNQNHTRRQREIHVDVSARVGGYRRRDKIRVHGHTFRNGFKQKRIGIDGYPENVRHDVAR